jgi:hypothetical protein
MAQDILAVLRSETWAHSILETNKFLSSKILPGRNVESHYPPKLSGPASMFKPTRFEKFKAKQK